MKNKALKTYSKSSQKISSKSSEKKISRQKNTNDIFPPKAHN
jgi:hypothetical protein